MIAELLKRAAYQTGHFILRSGKTSGEYLNVKKAMHDPFIGMEICTQLLLQFQHVGDADSIAGVAYGGIIPATYLTYMAAKRRGVRVFQLTVRKENKGHGITHMIDGIEHMIAGDTVSLIEDVVTEGDSAADAVNALQSKTLNVTSITAIVDREAGGLNRLRTQFPGIRVEALTTLSEIRAAD